MSDFSAASFFGFPGSWDDSPDASSTPGSEPQTPLRSVEATASGGVLSHPGLALFAVLGTAAYLIADTTKQPFARASVRGKIGKAQAGLEGEI